MTEKLVYSIKKSVKNTKKPVSFKPTGFNFYKNKAF